MQSGYMQILRRPMSSFYTGMCSYSNTHADVLSTVNNPAALAQITNIATGVFAENSFLLKATSRYTAALGIPTTNGSFGVTINYSGYQNFTENQLGVTYARSVGKKLDVGIQFNYYGYRIPGYFSASTIHSAIGAIAHVTDQFNIGLQVYNPVGGFISATKEKLMTVYAVGLGYDLGKHFYTGISVMVEEGAPVYLNVSMEYRFIKQFFIRAGISTATSMQYAGVGTSWNKFSLHLTGSYHPQLGLSPGMLLMMQLGNEKKELVRDQE